MCTNKFIEEKIKEKYTPPGPQNLSSGGVADSFISVIIRCRDEKNASVAARKKLLKQTRNKIIPQASLWEI